MVTPSLLHPRSLSGLLDLTFSLYRRSFISFLLVSAVSQIPLGLLQAWYQPTLNAKIALLISLGNQSSPSSTMLLRAIQGFIAIGLFFFVSVLATAITQAALTQAAIHTLADKAPQVARAYALGIPRYCATLTTATIIFLLQAIAVVCGVLGCAFLLVVVQTTLPLLSRFMFFGGGIILIGLAIGGLCCQIRLQLIVPAIVIEQVGPFHAIARSWQLTCRAFWRAGGFLCAVSFCYYLCILIPQNLVSFLFQQQTAALVVRYGSLTLATPIISLAYTMCYYDFRIRKEGYDLELQVQQEPIG
jgi:hypothetical protein